VIILKKIFYVLVFFIVAGGIFYFTNNLNPKGGVTIEELSRMINSGAKADGEKVEATLGNMKNENLFEKNKFLDFVEIGKSLQGKAKELYNSIILSNYKRNQSEFLKQASNLKTEQLNEVIKTLSEKNIDKSNIISSIQNTLKDKELTKEQAEKLAQLMEQIKTK
jgi:hypothetical protein